MKKEIILYIWRHCMMNEAIFNKHASNFVINRQTTDLGVSRRRSLKFKGVYYQSQGKITCVKEGVVVRLKEAHNRLDEVIINPLNGDEIEGPYPSIGHVISEMFPSHPISYYSSLTIANSEDFKDSINALKNLVLTQSRYGAFEINQKSKSITITTLTDQRKCERNSQVVIPILSEINIDSTFHFYMSDLYNVFNLLSENGPESIQIHFAGKRLPITLECGNAYIMLAQSNITTDSE